MQLRAPAKVNLHFRILGKREDGFHEIETLMAPITLADVLTLEQRSGEGLDFTCTDPSLPTDGSNLVVRAVDVFRRETGVTQGITLHLEKYIPHGAGLAGGSSDAASTLLGLNRLFGTGKEVPELAGMAAEIGSDIPFFLFESAAVCTGRGEKVAPVPLQTPLPLLLMKPEFGVPTPWAYRHWRDSREVPGFQYATQTFPWGELHNDLERSVFEKYLFLGVLKRWLLEQQEAVGALMSGSGSTIFTVLRDEQSGPALRDRALAEFGENLWSALCTTL
jgi:4-diphosphocytidyl-2-C-methyl-D-erythritol kinase